MIDEESYSSSTTPTTTTPEEKSCEMDDDIVPFGSRLRENRPLAMKYSTTYGAVTIPVSSSDPPPRPSDHDGQQGKEKTKPNCNGVFCRIRNKLFCLQQDRLPKDDKSRLEEALDQTHRVATISWKIATILSVIVAVIAVFRAKPLYEYYDNRTPEWKWDRNVYISTSSSGSGDRSGSDTDVPLAGARTSLVVQVTEDMVMRPFGKVSDRPNRAYARQWKLDYVEYYAGRAVYSSKSCFDKTFVLHTLVEKQREDTKDPSSLWPHAPRILYDTIVLIPPDAIITDMDEDIVEALLPRNKLAAIAGWRNSREKFSSSSGIVLFNLAHRHAMKVVDLWWKISQEPYQTCGAANGISALIDAIAVVMDQEKGESLEDLIQPIPDYPNGTVGSHVIKCLPSAVPGARSELFLSNQQQSVETIHQTADSVCYRFYPKCEVVL
ncbi:MAG: hypothetical protein SGILL_006332 [Bacillariaceae sp.]